jgi:hypothetical protein
MNNVVQLALLLYSTSIRTYLPNHTVATQRYRPIHLFPTPGHLVEVAMLPEPGLDVL